MPNTPVSVCSGVTIYTSGSKIVTRDEQMLDTMLSSVGISMKMEEHYMDIITGLTGCGPTYVSGLVWAYIYVTPPGAICSY